MLNLLLQCCAISFIENLTHESLSMPQSEFNALMSGQIAIHSVWESALMSCEMMHMLDENCKTITQLEKKNDETMECIQQMDKDIAEFKVSFTSLQLRFSYSRDIFTSHKKDNIFQRRKNNFYKRFIITFALSGFKKSLYDFKKNLYYLKKSLQLKKIFIILRNLYFQLIKNTMKNFYLLSQQENLSKNLNAVLQRTPFELKEIKTLQSLRDSLLPSSIKCKLPLDRPTQFQSNSSSSGGHFKSNLVSSMAAINLKSKESTFPFALDSESVGKSKEIDSVALSPNTLATDVDPFAGSSDMLLPTVSDPMKSSPSADYLSVSPSFGPCSLSFDNQSFDETTPDEFAPINFLKGITNINYDFTFSDNSAENSISEDVGELTNQSNVDAAGNPLKASDSTSSFNLDEFDPLRNVETASKAVASSQPKPLNISLTDPKPTTLIESEDSPNQVLLPSPLKPTATDYKGFSNSNIPTISCNTGDFSSLNYSDPNNQQSWVHSVSTNHKCT